MNNDDVFNDLKVSTSRMLGYDPESLTPWQDAKVNTVAQLLLSQDRHLTALLAGQTVDPRLISTIGEQLEAALRPTEERASDSDAVFAKLSALMDGLAEDYLFRMSAGEPIDTGGLSPLARLVHRIMDRAIAGRDAAVAAAVEREAAAVPPPPITPLPHAGSHVLSGQTPAPTNNTRTSYPDLTPEPEALSPPPSAPQPPKPAPPPSPLRTQSLHTSGQVPSHYLKDNQPHEAWREHVNADGNISTQRRGGPPGGPPRGW